MSERERWIVYPLLFLALGAALRDKLFDQTTSKRIVCQELTVIDEAPPGREPLLLARIGRLEQANTGATAGGFLFVNGQVSVSGSIDSQNYSIRGVPLVPSLQAIVPPDVLNAFQQWLRGAQKPAPPQAQPGGDTERGAGPDPPSEPVDGAPADASSPADEEVN